MRPNPNNADLGRSLGRLEGDVAGMSSQLDRIELHLNRIDVRLSALEADRNQRRGAMALATVLAGLIGGALVKAAAMLGLGT
jgi:hypothetical protein